MLERIFFSRTELQRSFRLFHSRKRDQLFRDDTRGSPTLLSLLQNFEQLGSSALKAIAADDYELGAASSHLIFVDKQRIVQHFNWLDTFLIFHLARTLADISEPLMPECLFSYRRGKSVASALALVQHYLRAGQPSLVLRRDVKNFGEEMDHELLLLDFDRYAAPSPALRKFFEQVCRFRGSVGSNQRGLPSGHYIQLVCSNLFLLDLDLQASKLAGRYVRFGDDILFMAKDLKTFEAARELIDSALLARKLENNAAKAKDLLVCDPAPKAGAAVNPTGYQSCSTFTYLGAQVFWNGNLAVPTGKMRRLRRALERHITAACRAVQDCALDRRLRVAIEAVKNLRFENSLLAEGKSVAAFLKQEACSEDQLRELDRWLELLVIKCARGRGFKKGHFSRLPPGHLRSMGLPSLVHLRRTHVR